MKKENNIYQYDIATLILAYLRGEISADDQRRLDAWLAESDSHRVVLEQVSDEKLQHEEIQKILSRDANRAWEVVKRKAIARRRQRMVNVFRVAASVVVLLGVGIASWVNWPVQQTEAVLVEISEILPGRATAKLTTASGTTFQLDSMNSVELAYASAESDGKEVVFTDRISEDSVKETKLNKIEIPRGGEYRITLGDGTKVYLNSQTELEFPESFANGDTREVYLSGEAYFDVAKDKAKPFIVHCKDYSIKVLGTSFNVASYKDEVDSRTTLATGKVEINTMDQKILLKPGQQAVIKGREVDVQHVDVEIYTTWMHENFRFQSENIEDIMKKLSRWYSVDVFYTNQGVKEYHFTGYLPRYANITDVLELLSLTTNIKFEVRDRTVMVMEK